MTTSPQISKLTDRAIRYAEHGWFVFPLQPREKQPLLPRGFLAASNEPPVVKTWWRQHPTANIGLWPGKSGLIVIDLDGPEGEASGRALGLMSEPTLQVVTGREDGGRHLYFKRPDFSVANGKLAPKIDIRCDNGYVILPPSLHPSGRVYTWLGKVDEVHDLPPQVIELLRANPNIRLGASGVHESAKDIAFADEISEGGRNEALTRYAGRLLALRMDEAEVVRLVQALNAANCRPPLPPVEVSALVASIAKREATKRMTSTGNTIALVDEQPTPEIPAPIEVAAKQVEGSRQLLTRDVSTAPRWAWRDLDAVVDVMLPGDLIVVGSLMGNGKSTLLMSQMDAFARAKMPTLYIPLEVDPEVCRLRWAAWRLGIDVRHAIRQEWAQLPEGSREAIDNVLEEQERDPYVHFAPPKRMTPGELLAWCEWARKEFNCRVVMLDHIHRMNFGQDTSFHRVTVTDVVRRLKDMARDLGIVLIAAAQLNRSSDPVDQYSPPLLSRLKESAGIGEEADVVLMLSRKLQRDLPKQWQSSLRLGQLSERDIAEPGIMAVTCRKHRLDDEALNKRVLLRVANGRVEDRPSLFSSPPPRWEPQ